jgi:hypothetical protein
LLEALLLNLNCLALLGEVTREVIRVWQAVNIGKKCTVYAASTSIK